MRWLRFGFALIKARFKSKLSITDDISLSFRVWLTDVDVSVMNNAALLTIMETGRLDFMVRTNFFKVAAKNKWFFPSRAISVQFYRPMKVFQKAELKTKISFVDEKWIYTQHKIIRKGKVIAVCLVKSIIKKGRETVPTSEVMKALNIQKAPTDKHELIKTHELENSQMDELLIDKW